MDCFALLAMTTKLIKVSLTACVDSDDSPPFRVLGFWGFGVPLFSILARYSQLLMIPDSPKQKNNRLYKRTGCSFK
jgi:hypothetical protein